MKEVSAKFPHEFEGKVGRTVVMTVSDNLDFVSVTSPTMIALQSLHDTLLKEPVIFQRRTMPFQTAQTRVKRPGGVRVSISWQESFLSRI